MSSGGLTQPSSPSSSTPQTPTMLQRSGTGSGFFTPTNNSLRSSLLSADSLYSSNEP